MTYNVFSGTLNLAQSNRSLLCCCFGDGKSFQSVKNLHQLSAKVLFLNRRGSNIKQNQFSHC